MNLKSHLIVNSLLTLFVSGAWNATYRVADRLPVGALGKVSSTEVSAAIEAAAAQLKSGDALILPEVAFGTVHLPELPNNVQFLGGRGSLMKVRGRLHGTLFFGGEYHFDASEAEGLEGNSFFIHQKSDITGGNFENTYWIDNIGRMDIDGTMRNSIGVWMRYNHEGRRFPKSSFTFKLNGTGQGVKILHMVEHNQGNKSGALEVHDADGIQFAGGSTEGCGGDETRGFINLLKNCRNTYLGLRRYFSGKDRDTGPARPLWQGGRSWRGYPILAVVVEGGNNNVLDNVVDISNVLALSLQSSDPNLQTWVTSWENNIELQNAQNVFHYGLVENSNPVLHYFAEPRSIDTSWILARETSGGREDLLKPNQLESVTFPPPPDLPACDIPKPPKLKYKQAASFGAELLAAGADPTGKTASDHAFSKVLAKRSILELPPGRFLLSKPLLLHQYSSGKIRIHGSGREVSHIVYRGRGAAIRNGGLSLAKAQGVDRTFGTGSVLTDLTVDGGEYGFELNQTNAFQMNVSYKGYSIAGVYKAGGNAEQGRWISCTFDGGQYGWRLNGFSDKYLLYRCHFKNHSKGGIYCTNLVNWQGGIYQSTFENINGPGVGLYGGGGNGYGPYSYRIDGCTFTNCGSRTEPALFNGYGWLGAVSNTTITTTGKQILAGFRGNFAILQDLQVDVPDGVPALQLGHQGFEKTAGAIGARLVRINSNGPIEFLDRKELMMELNTNENPSSPACPDAEGSYKKCGYAPGMWEGKPWAWNYLFHQVKATNFDTEYGIVWNGKVMVDLVAKTLDPDAFSTSLRSSTLQMPQQPTILYTIDGKKVQSRGSTFAPLPGLYLRKRAGGMQLVPRLD